VPRILIIDDERDVRDSVAKILERAGFEVHVADGGAAGLEAYRSHGADVVITDIIMPETHGVDVIAALRQADNAVRIIAISGGGNFGLAGYQPGAITTNAYLAAASKVGADAILTKPFERQELLDLVNGLVRGGAGPGGPH
jgi:DNA-binding response OmpR family regulator